MQYACYVAVYVLCVHSLCAIEHHVCGDGYDSNGAARGSYVRTEFVHRSKPRANVSYDGTYPCDTCSCVFDDPESCREHENASHKFRYVYTCLSCNKTSWYRRALIAHVRTHYQGKEYCEACNEWFSNLLNHKRSKKHARKAQLAYENRWRLSFYAIYPNTCMHQLGTSGTKRKRQDTSLCGDDAGCAPHVNGGIHPELYQISFHNHRNVRSSREASHNGESYMHGTACDDAISPEDSGAVSTHVHNNADKLFVEQTMHHVNNGYPLLPARDPETYARCLLGDRGMPYRGGDT